MISLLLSLLLATLISSSKVTTKDLFCNDPDCDLDTFQLITSKGYPAETHIALSSDGYQLTIHRIPGLVGRKATKGPVFLQHGLLDASHTWVLNFPAQSLGFILADAGYDVWMGNVRGNTYSLKNIHFKTDSNKFWDFSFDDFIRDDLPTMIDYVLKECNASNLHYVGHSQGTVMGFGGFSDAAYAEKVKLFVALSPVAYMGHLTPSLFQYLSEFDADVLLAYLGFREFLPNTAFADAVMSVLCRVDASLCEGAMCAIMGCNTQNWNNTRWPVYVHHDPAGTSVKNMAHYAQAVRSNLFEMFDYGTKKNVEIYHQKTPPSYKLSELKVPVALFTGGQDYLADPTDVARLISELPQSKLVYKKNNPPYSHLDPIWGLNANKDIYSDILHLFSQYDKPTQ